MDERFNNSVILDLRKGELSLENIKQNVDILFSKVALIPGWSFSGSEWASQIKQTMKEEIKRSVVRTLKVKVKNARDEEIIFPIQFPELVDEQFFYIGGLLKVPVFQIVDKPIIYRKLSNGNFLLKLRTNTISLELQKDSKENYSVNLFGKKMLLEDLFCCTHSKAIYENWKLVNSDAIEKCDEDAKLLLEYMEERFYPRWESIKTKDDKSRIIGEYFTNYENEEYSKGTTIINSLIVARELDVYNQQYMTNNTLLLEILQAIIEGYKNDLDVSNKRIRLLEYILNPLMKKLFEMIIAVLKNKDTNFKIHQNIIMENCNVSDIIHFNFVLNPVGEIASLMQCTLTGPNGFKKTNVPMHLRNVDDSQFGYICPVDTPDRDGCGVVLNMVPTVDIKDGEFGERDEEIVTSYPINLTPFLNSDDGIRLQMASNQCKQSIYISGREKPFVKSGVEDCYLDKGTFLGKAKYSGIVVYKDNKILLVKYDTGEFDVFKINYRSLFLNTADIIDSMVNVNDHFKEGDILVQSRFITDGELTIGKNLHTLVMPMLGYNYEDGIIVSESASKSMVSSHFVDLSFEIESGQVLLSLVGDKYHPLPKIGDKLKTGEVYARLKCIDWEDGFEAINREPIEKTAPIDCVVTGIEIYPNQWNKKIEEFNLFINSLVNEQSYKYNELTSILKSSMTDQEIKNFITYNGLSYLNCEKNIGKYSVKNDKINGVLIKINAVFEEAVDAGDKLANRHGNKGIVSCCDTRTYIFTDSGWKLFKDLTDDDKVAYIKDKDTMTAGFVKPEKIIVSDYTGPMYGHRVVRTGVDYLMTPNHRMYRKTNTNSSYKVATAENVHNKSDIIFYTKFNLDDKEYDMNKTVCFENNYAPCIKKLPPLEFNTGDFCEFLGWFLSEGCIFNDTYKKSNSFKIIISQTKPDNREKIYNLLTRMKVKFNASGKNFQFYHKPLYEYLKQFGYSKDRYIPEFVFHESKKNLKLLFDSLILGDGSIRSEKFVQYYSISKRLVEDISRLATLLGYKVQPIREDSKNRKNTKFIISINIDDSIQSVSLDPKQYYVNENYNDKIYCVTVPNSLIFVKRDGIPFWTGNSVMPDNKMPKLDDGRQVDIVINSLGIISRMNPGQIFEMHCGECLKKLRDKLSTMKEPADEKYLVKILKIIDETPTLWVTRHIFDNYVKNKKDKGKEYAIQEICFIMPPFNCTSANIIKEKLMVELGVKSEFEVEIPDVGKVKNPIAAGYMYWSKLVHRASEKMSARSIGMYSQKTNQPLGGKKRGGGHRLGEMEQWAFVSHGADNFLKDLMTIHSDSPGLKNKLLSSMLNNSTDIIEEELEDKPQAIMLMESYFKQMGLEIETSEE